jgi:hypothetical protein
VEDFPRLQISNFRSQTGLRKDIKTALRLDRTTQKSGIRGQRHFDEKQKAAYANRQERDEFLKELNRLSPNPQKP